MASSILSNIPPCTVSTFTNTNHVSPIEKNTNKKLKYIIIDTGIFIRLKRLDTIAENIITTTTVLNEIRDKQARQSIKIMLETPQIRQPSENHIKRVKDFTLLSGDFNRLSITDIHVIALTLMISEEHEDISTFKTKPLELEVDSNNLENFEWGPKPLSNKSQQQENTTDDVTETNSLSNEVFSSSEDEGWITDKNIHRLGKSVSKVSNIKVACLTTDYTIQNVLLKMGLHIISIDGYQITHIKNWILKCQACHHFENDTNKIFCSHCGNNTLISLSVTTDSSGQSQVHMIKRAPKLRGTIYTLPNPQKSKNLILREDQLLMGGRDRELRHQKKLWEKNISNKNPFNPDSLITQQGWWHRKFTPSGRFEIKGLPKIEIGMGKGNPNSNRWMKKKNKYK